MRDVVPYGELKLKAEGSAGMTAKELVAWADELREAACTTQCSYTATIDTFEFSAGHWIWICPACSEHHMIGEEPND